MKTKIISIGNDAFELIDAGVLIMFNPNAPQELKDVAALHEKQGDETNVLHVGGQISFGDQSFKIDFVGNDANQNFDKLGHLSIYFNNTDEDVGKLPGSIFVSSNKTAIPTLEVNQVVTIQ
ncbi:PTS glucitol/sorbitol transporter subunit IIA [Xylocopilactobacillus apicola]|uniref:PTS sorbitol transporter subunit IIA n=1 Tax=Xylocopilactobacillus apicola TaxID=2932184 RepID=A0AAU9DL23_9LACO|nr:PTS glucitol/sorbitol transporter subunit IIA [Xylocopilactobacillus apicola]BDR57567.1 PTS sorbitol transporter subunit IIA [Xylocopilactobacillus apicola]